MGKPTDRDEVGKSEDGEKTEPPRHGNHPHNGGDEDACRYTCLLYTSDAADEEDSGDLGGRRTNKKKKKGITVSYTNPKKTRRQ